MKISWCHDKFGKSYIKREGWFYWILVVCRQVGESEVNLFLEDNPDCSVLIDIGGLIIIAFTDDLGRKEI